MSAFATRRAAVGPNLIGLRDMPRRERRLLQIRVDDTVEADEVSSIAR